LRAVMSLLFTEHGMHRISAETMRMIMGLDRPTSGTVTVNGKPYRQHPAPLREVRPAQDAAHRRRTR
jgi:hypothetical protein